MRYLFIVAIPILLYTLLLFAGLPPDFVKDNGKQELLDRIHQQDLIIIKLQHKWCTKPLTKG